jgi:hypothetical protein
MELSPELATIAVAAYGTTAPKAPINPPKLFICGFPKSGMHLAVRYALGMLTQWDPEDNWYGTNAWDNEPNVKILEGAALVLGSVKRGQYIKGHLAYVQAVESVLQILGFGLMFVYRDLRDVIVSQAYHFMSEDEVRFIFKHRDYYQGMSKEEIMLRAINGDENIDGIIERWEKFAGWLDCDWILPMRFEEMVLKRERAAKRFFEYVYNKALEDSGVEVQKLDDRIRKAALHCILAESEQKEMSVTFRKGKVGQWKHEFTPAVKAAFKERDVNNWLVELGYAKDKDW